MSMCVCVSVYCSEKREEVYVLEDAFNKHKKDTRAIIVLFLSIVLLSAKYHLSTFTLTVFYET